MINYSLITIQALIGVPRANSFLHENERKYQDRVKRKNIPQTQPIAIERCAEWIQY